MRFATRYPALLAGAALLLSVPACTLQNVDPPGPAGPSEITPSVSLQALPDTLTWDGQDQSQISIVARNANGHPHPNLVMRAEIWLDGHRADFGELTPRQFVTNASGQATLFYRAPPPPVLQGVSPVQVNIVVVPVGTDTAGTVPKTVKIRVVPIVGPQNDNPLALFTFSPLQPGAGETIFFDARDSQAAPGRFIVAYDWDFGKGTTGVGQMVQKAYNTPDAYVVRLTVTDNMGGQGSFIRHVPVGQ